MSPRRPNPSFLNGVPELLVLHELRSGEMYGYEIARAIRERTGEEIAMGEGVLYAVLHGLEDARCLASRTETVAGRPRVYYRLTAKGRARLAATTSEWARVTHAVAKALGGRFRAPAGA